MYSFPTSSALPIFSHFAIAEQHGAVAIPLDGADIMRDQNDGLAHLLVAGEFAEAFGLEVGVADRQDFVHEQDLAIGMDGHGEGQPDLHAGGIILYLLVYESLSSSEKATMESNLASISFSQRPRTVAFRYILSRPESSGLKPMPSSRNGETEAVDLD
jgi:hypothetical protein